jgi:hypothetical protein
MAEVTQVQEAATATESTHVMAMLAAETSARDVAIAQDSTILHLKDAEDWVALVEREALERVSKAEAENAVALASAHADAKSFACKIALHEDELTAEHWA